MNPVDLATSDGTDVIVGNDPPIVGAPHVDAPGADQAISDDVSRMVSPKSSKDPKESLLTPVGVKNPPFGPRRIALRVSGARMGDAVRPGSSRTEDRLAGQVTGGRARGVSLRVNGSRFSSVDRDASKKLFRDLRAFGAQGPGSDASPVSSEDVAEETKAR